MTQLIAAIRRVRREVPGAAALVAQRCSAHDYDDPGKPRIAWDDVAARDALVDALVRDALAVVQAVGEQPPGPGADAVALLALVAGQDVELVHDPHDPGARPRWRIAQRVAKDRLISVVDPEARHAHKSVSRRQDGFKAHVAVEPDTGLVTDCALTKASGPGSHDAEVGIDLLTDETGHCQVLGDSAYGTGEARAALADTGHDAVIKPWPMRPSVPEGFTADDFTVDEQNATLTCPAGNTRAIPPNRKVTFGSLCRSCPLRARCTRSPRGRQVLLHEHESLLRAARRQAQTPEFAEVYRQYRPMVERTIAWLVRAGARKVRYRGVARNDQWLHHRSAALNLRRLLALGLTRANEGWALA